MSDFEEAKLFNRAFVEYQRQSYRATELRQESKEKAVNGFVDVQMKARVRLSPQQQKDAGEMLETKLQEIERRIKADVLKRGGRKPVISRIDLLDGTLEVRAVFRMWVKEDALLAKLERDAKLAEALSK